MVEQNESICIQTRFAGRSLLSFSFSLVVLQANLRFYSHLKLSLMQEICFYCDVLSFALFQGLEEFVGNNRLEKNFVFF
jgi:hypothetical protein